MLPLLLTSILAASTVERPADFVDIEDVADGVVVEARYFGTDNFVGAKVDGYLAPKCLLSAKAAKAPFCAFSRSSSSIVITNLVPMQSLSKT